VLGVVGAGGIGGVLLNTLRYRQFPQAGAVVLLTVLLVLSIDSMSGAIRKRLVRG
jgi:phosphonate transport system permease protein